jgi:HD-GYP domain-containing protein (c-di-GMP phosphodiesterase class II)
MSHISIRVSTLRGDQKIDFDAFVKINEKFVLYLRKGDSFEGDRLKRLKEKKLKKMFILEGEESLYRTYLDRNIEMAYDASSGKSLDNRAAIVQGNQQANTEDVMENPESVENYNEAKDGASKFIRFLQQEENAVGHVLNIENMDKNIAHHGVTVSTLANALAKRLGITDSKQLQALTLGAMLHDLEHFHTQLDVARPLAKMSPDEMKVYKDHPMAGGRRVQNHSHFDKSVINIIIQHEEFIDGRGFPKGLKESQMDPLAVIVASANALDRLITFEGTPRNEGAKNLLLNAVGRYPLQHIQLLGEVMKSVS